MSNDNDIILYDTGEAAGVTKVNKQPVKTFDLIPVDSPILHKKTSEFNFQNPPVDPNEFASTLVETCKKYSGLGLSANQCGYPYRVFVMGSGDNYIACFNPKVISTEGEAHMAEGCLSFPLLQLRVTRPKKINVEYQDWNGEKHTATFDGITARVFLHELDHMEGIVYTSRVKPLALQSGIKKLEKIKRKYFNPNMMKKIVNGQKTSNN
jgi:peptide deformylase